MGKVKLNLFSTDNISESDIKMFQFITIYILKKYWNYILYLNFEMPQRNEI